MKKFGFICLMGAALLSTAPAVSLAGESMVPDAFHRASKRPSVSEFSNQDFEAFLKKSLRADDVTIKDISKFQHYVPLTLTDYKFDIAFHKDGKLYTALVPGRLDQWVDPINGAFKKSLYVRWDHAKIYLQNEKGKWKRTKIPSPQWWNFDYYSSPIQFTPEQVGDARGVSDQAQLKDYALDTQQLESGQNRVSSGTLQ